MNCSEINRWDGQGLFKVVSFRVSEGIAAIRIDAQTHTLYHMKALVRCIGEYFMK